MKTISFKLMPYITGKGEVSDEWKELTLFVDGVKICQDSINWERWQEADLENKDRHMFRLINEDLDNALYWKHAQFEDSDMYDRWYKYEFFINGEDAHEFIRRVPRTMHPRTFNDFQASVAVTEGWKHYKALRSADFNETTAANLAYWRGYITGMEWGYHGEGREVLTLMGLKPIKDI